jgi:hypothetical protein
MAWRKGKEGKRFIFEKKEAKNFFCCRAPLMDKSFLVLFFEKEHACFACILVAGPG